MNPSLENRFSEPEDFYISPDEAVQRLALYVDVGYGRVLINCESEYSRQTVVAGVRGLKKEDGERYNVVEIRLPAKLLPVDLMEFWRREIENLPSKSVVFISGWNSVFPADGIETDKGIVPLHELFGAWNFYRELMFKSETVQIWWMPKSHAHTFMNVAIDSYSWFQLTMRVKAETRETSSEAAAGMVQIADRNHSFSPSGVDPARRQLAEILAADWGDRDPLPIHFQILKQVARVVGGLVAQGLSAEARAFYDETDQHPRVAPGLLANLEEILDVADLDRVRRMDTSGVVLFADALGELGETMGDMRYLEASISGYQLALRVITREDRPSDWATTQNNLGNVLRSLGERSGDDATLARSVEAYELALEVYTRESSPSDWAMTQNNLGIVLRTLGERSGDPDTLNQSVRAYELALEVRTRESSPSKWAMTQNNLGLVLRTLGERSGDPAHLARSVCAYELALEVWTREAFPSYRRRATLGRGEALLALWKLTEKESLLREIQQLEAELGDDSPI